MKLLRTIVGAFLIFSIVFTFTVGRNKISEGGVDTSPTEYKGIITVWQVDSFEGGAGSRKQFLLKAARGYEKLNDGVLVMVSDYTVDGVKDALNSGLRPDMISFGCGVEITGFSELNTDRSTNGGMVGGKTYAVAWCRGGYVLIANPTLTEEIPDELDGLVVSQGEYTQPLTALALEGITAKNAEIKSPMDAYVKFVAGKTPYFLGTQRDIVRLSNRGFDVMVRPLERYNDLYQYISVTGQDELKRFYAEKFINYLLSDTVQQKLTDISMLSPYIDIDHDDKHLSSMQKVKEGRTVSAFIQQEVLREMQSLSPSLLSGEKEALNKIKNILV